MRVRTILVSQPNPADNSPYFELQDKHKVKIDFRSFIHVEGVDARDVRQQKIDFNNYSAVILTSRNAVDNYFKIAEEMRFQVPVEMKYFCLSDAVANYLQHHIIYRKRKIYVGERTIQDLVKVMKKHKEEKFLLPTSDQLKPEIPDALNESGVEWDRAILYRTVPSDLSDVKIEMYDMLVFFSPIGIESLFKNFPNFQQENTRIAAFGKVTHEAAENAGLNLNVKAPNELAPSMTKALELYLKEANKGVK